jgi:integrase
MKTPASARTLTGEQIKPSTNQQVSTKEICMADSSDWVPQHHRTFLELSEPTSDGSRRDDAVRRNSASGRSNKGERYELSRVEKGIRRRVRRDGTGKLAYEVSVWVSGRALSRTFSVLRDARRWRDEMLGDRSTGKARIPKDRRITVAQFVKEDWYRWLDEQVHFGNLQPTTVRWYRYGARRLVAEIGRVKLTNVGKRELRRMLARRIKAGDSESIISQLRKTAKSVLALAVENDILTDDPSKFMTGRHAPQVPRGPAKALKSWSETEARTFLQHVVGDPLEALWVLFLGSGLRRGEALALRWEDADLDNRTLSVSRSLTLFGGAPVMSHPKTKTSTRVISVGTSVIDALQAHRRRQAQDRLAASDWPDDEQLIFTNATGGKLRPDYVTPRLKKLVAEAGLPWITVHGLRHTMASIALQNGTDIATVSERLGHADTSITARIYLHGSKESDRAAADALDAALHG